MLEVRPSRKNKIYIAFKTLRNHQHRNTEEFELLCLARKLVEEIAEQEYPRTQCIAGAMIMMDDLEQMESEGIDKALEGK